MLCSICNKNTAVIFVNKQLPDNSIATEGFCYECAKKKGIAPIDALAKQANLSEEDLKNMTEQLEDMIQNMSSDMDIDAVMDNYNSDSSENPDGIPNAIPLGAIFSNIFGKTQDSSANSSESGEKKKVKVDKKTTNKKKKTLDTFGTNLTNKAKNNEIDLVVGRNKEIQRMIQILNRRSKNNPCLIGEPGVGKTAIAQGLALRIASGKVPDRKSVV